MRRSRLHLALALLLGLAGLAALVLPGLMVRAAERQLHSWSRLRGLETRWSRARGRLPAQVRFERLVAVSQARGDTLLAASKLDLALDPWSLLAARPRLASVVVERATIRLPRPQAGADTLPPEPANERENPARAERLRRAAESVVRLLLTPARQLPTLTLRDVTLDPGGAGEDALPEIRLSWLDLEHRSGSARMRGAGSLQTDRVIPVEASLDYARDDRLRGGLRVRVPDPERGDTSEVRVALDGAVTQDRRGGRVIVHDSTRVLVGRIPIRLGAVLERRGPKVRLRLDAQGLDERRFKSSLPAAFLGRLAEIGVDGSWDHHVALDLDFAEPDSVRFEARVVPHGLALDPGRTRLNLQNLDRAFTAAIHLPRDRTVYRALSPENPHFRPLGDISPHLVAAVVTNEDGAFFRHRGFNTEAFEEAIAENLKAGAFRRGAGTITMQLVRNLYLGHERSLGRKFREVVLAWVVERLTATSKHRLLEIYLNVIEWGPGIHGVGEAARFYFDRDPAELDLAEALFLSTIVPAPAKWRYRFDSLGELRPYARAQMHFIGRAMVAKGWLAAEALPEAEHLRVELRGPARAIHSPRPPDTLEAGVIGIPVLDRIATAE